MVNGFETATLASFALLGCNACVDSSPANTESVTVAASYQLDQSAALTREQPILSQIVDGSPSSGVAFARITIAQNKNPEHVPVYFELFLFRSDKEPIRLGSFAPYPPNREQAYLVGLRTIPREGDRLELRMSFTQPAVKGDVHITFLPIELIDRETASKRQ